MFTALPATLSLRNSGYCKTRLSHLDTIPDAVDLHCFAAKELMCPPCLRLATLDPIGHTNNRFFRVGGSHPCADHHSTCQCDSAQGVQSEMTVGAKSQNSFGPTNVLGHEENVCTTLPHDPSITAYARSALPLYIRRMRRLL